MRGRFTATVAAVGALLLSSGLLVAATAPAAVANSETCNRLGYTKIDRSSGSFSAAWGDIQWSGSTLRYDIDSGYAVDFCLKSGSKSGTVTYPGLRGSGSVQTGAYTHKGTTKHQAISHIGYRVTSTPPSGPKTVTPTVTFEEPTCVARSVVATALVNGVVDATERQLEHGSDTDDHGVTFAITSGSIAKNSSVTITATAASGYEFPGGVSTKTFPNTFGDVPSDCGGTDTELTAPSVSFTEPTCEKPKGAKITFGNQDEVDYAIAGVPGPGEGVVVHASPKAGFEFAPGTQETFHHTFKDIAARNCAGDEPTVAGTQTTRPRPDKEPNANEGQPPVVLGTQTAIPTAVDAGAAGGPDARAGSTTLLGRLGAGAGLLLLVAAGWTLIGGRRRHGGHEI
jgi:hypothetical protein